MRKKVIALLRSSGRAYHHVPSSLDLTYSGACLFPARLRLVARERLTAVSALQTVTASRPLEVARIRKDFPILSRRVHGKRLVFLDSAASAQKPQAVIDAERHLYEAEYANVHREGVFD